VLNAFRDLALEYPQFQWWSSDEKRPERVTGNTGGHRGKSTFSNLYPPLLMLQMSGVWKALRYFVTKSAFWRYTIRILASGCCGKARGYIWLGAIGICTYSKMSVSPHMKWVFVWIVHLYTLLLYCNCP